MRAWCGGYDFEKFTKFSLSLSVREYRSWLVSVPDDDKVKSCK